MRFTKTAAWLLGPALLFAPILHTTDADAGIGACGDIEVSADAQCELLVEGGCLAQCEPVNFTAACHGECSGTCSVEATAECTGSCSADCEAECEVDPGSFSCEGSCEAECSGSCDAECSTSADQSQCRASCEASCSGECTASCQGTPPEATCSAKCDASCEGSCRAEVNAECQIDCQGGCVAELEGGCEVQCEEPDGALFCDGQYVDHGGNLEECINALNAIITANIEYEASASGSCSGGRCEGQADASVSCAASGAGHQGSGVPLLAGALTMLGLSTLRRRRRAG